MKLRKHLTIIFAIMAIVYCALFCSIMAEAKSTTPPKNGRYEDAQGNLYIYRHGKPRTGWFSYKGKRYYGYKSNSRMHPKGSVARDVYRVKNNKLYYFGHSGAKQTRDSRYITLNRHSTSVHYIYAPGMIRRYRYNVNHKRYQYLNDAGRWEDVGMQCWPEGMVDWQR